MNYKVTETYIGVDISKDTLHVCAYPEMEKFVVKNSATGLDQLISKISNYNVKQVVCESSGGYGYLMIQRLRKAGYSVWQVDPKRIKAFICSEGIKAKTDSIDSEMIAKFAAEKKCKYNPNSSFAESNEHLRAIVKKIEILKCFAAGEKKRLKQEHDTLCKKITEKNIQNCEKLIALIDKEIELEIEKSEEKKAKAKLLNSIPGIGKLTIAVLIACMPELGSVGGKQATALLGAAPYSNQSGKFSGVERTSGGRMLPRNALYMAALSASRYNPQLKNFYDRLKSKNKKSKVALVAVMRKLIVYANTLLQKGEMWNPVV